MVNAFYNSPYDVRKIESKILNQKVSDCVYVGGRMNFDLIDSGIFKEEFKDNFLDKCFLNFDVLYEWQAVEYYVGVDFIKEEDLKTNEPVFSIEAGNANGISDCDLEKESEKSVKCTRNNFYASEGGQIYQVNVLTVVRKTGNE